jgi:hypothetical protein
MDGCFGYSIPLYKSASFNYRLNVPQNKFPMTISPWMGSKRGRGWGIYICKHAHQQTTISIKATSISNTIKDEQFTQQSLCTLWLNRCVLCMDLLCFFLFIVSWEIHCTMKRNVINTLDKARIALAFFSLAMQGWCILSILGMGELKLSLDHPLGSIRNKEMCRNGTKSCVLDSCWAHGG